MKISKEERRVAKERSFVYKLQKKDYEIFLAKLGFKLAYLSDADGKQIPPIRRHYDAEKKSYVAMVNCTKEKDKVEKMVESALYSKYPFLAGILGTYTQTTLLVLTDFEISTMEILPQDLGKLQNEYAHFMWRKFGDYYKVKYNQHVRRLNKKVAQESKEK